MGFYSVTPGLNYYTIGTPLFEKATINLENGNIFTINAKNISKKNNEPLVLNNEVDIKKNNLSNVPKDTEKIILQAEKFLKK